MNCRNQWADRKDVQKCLKASQRGIKDNFNIITEPIPQFKPQH